MFPLLEPGQLMFAPLFDHMLLAIIAGLNHLKCKPSRMWYVLGKTDPAWLSSVESFLALFVDLGRAHMCRGPSARRPMQSCRLWLPYTSMARLGEKESVARSERWHEGVVVQRLWSRGML